MKRKLIAIFNADVKGYSLLMGKDEEMTVITLNVYKELMVDSIKQHRGRVIDFTGDNLLAEFKSVVDSVECAVDIQKVLKAKNKELPDDKKMELRIGVNLGDVLQDGDRIYGDGVNVAARIESLSEAGGICISRSVYDQVKKKLKLDFEYFGDHEVKNINEPVRVYKVRIEKDSKENTAPSIGDKKISPAHKENSIAVLPFMNMSEDPKQEFFCDGLTEGIIATLSKSPDLIIISRNSTFTYKDKAVKVQQVREDLGVRYVLEGSVQKSDERVRITAQLIDAINGKHMWADRYDRDMKEIFTLQDEIAIHILEAMQWKLSIGSRAREALGKGTTNLESYLKLVEGQHYLIKANPEDYKQAKKLFEEAISLDPSFVSPYIFLGVMHALEAQRGWSSSPIKSIEEATRLANKAEELDRSHPSLYILLGLLKLGELQYDEAIKSFEHTMELDPGNSIALFNIGNCLVSMGKTHEAIHVFEKMLRIDPLSPGMAFKGLGHAYAVMERYEDAISYHNKVIAINPTFLLPRIRNAACYAALGRTEEAHTSVAELLKLYPKFSINNFTMVMTYKDQFIKERWITNLRKAGFPE